MSAALPAAAAAASAAPPATLLAASAATAAAEAAISAPEAAASAAMAEAAGATAATAAEAAALAAEVASSFLPQAARATAATRAAKTSDLFIFILNQRVRQLPGIEGTSWFPRAPSIRGTATLKRAPCPVLKYTGPREDTYRPSVVAGNASAERCEIASMSSRARKPSAGRRETMPRQRNGSSRRKLSLPGAYNIAGTSSG